MSVGDSHYTAVAGGADAVLQSEEVDVADSEVAVGEAVEGKVETGVGVGEQDAEDVQLLGVYVIDVSGYYDSVGRPAHGKHHKDDEEGPGQLQGFLHDLLLLQQLHRMY